MSRFGAEPRDFFRQIYTDVAPWDVGAPQPALWELLQRYPPATPVLDVGCGTGDLAIALARVGLDVVAVDFAEAAIDEAKSRASALSASSPLAPEFITGDALHLSWLSREFGAVVDSGFMHLFDAVTCDEFERELASVLVEGGRYYVLAFATEFPIPNTPRSISADELRERFTPEKGWLLQEMSTAEFQSRIAPVPATLACFERARG